MPVNLATPLLHDFLAETARRVPDKEALVAGPARLTYREVRDRASALAAWLRARGVARGDRVVVFADNGPEVAIAFWAALEASAVVSVVSPQTKADKLAYVLNDCRAAALVADARLAPAYVPAAARSPHLRVVVVAQPFAPSVAPRSGAESRGERELPEHVPLDVALAEGAALPRPRREALDEDLAAILYTSGSTGEPKGVMLTHRNMVAAATSILAYLGTREDDRVLCVLPLAFDYGLYQMIMAFRVGATLVVEKGFAFPAEVLGRVVSEEVTVLPGVPTLFATIADLSGLERWDLSRVRIVTNTAAALAVRHIRFLQRTFPRARVFSMYGLTECKRCTYLPPEDLDRKPESVGVAIPNTELWLVDEADRRLGPGEVGQLVIRGATVMKGYWEKPEATAKKLRPGPVPGERVLYTGDLCRLDEEGYLYFVARMDDVIKTRGEKVAPKEVEAALVNVPGVREAAVIGVPDPVLGEAVKAFVVLEQGAALSEGDLRRECQRRLEPFAVPKRIELVAELPRTTTGKIQKQGLSRGAA